MFARPPIFNCGLGVDMHLENERSHVAGGCSLTHGFAQDFYLPVPSPDPFGEVLNLVNEVNHVPDASNAYEGIEYVDKIEPLGSFDAGAYLMTNEVNKE